MFFTSTILELHFSDQSVAGLHLHQNPDALLGQGTATNILFSLPPDTFSFEPSPVVE
jgi:hypothetical protein